jgi:hypothetical protein
MSTRPSLGMPYAALAERRPASQHAGVRLDRGRRAGLGAFRGLRQIPCGIHKRHRHRRLTRLDKLHIEFDIAAALALVAVRISLAHAEHLAECRMDQNACIVRLERTDELGNLCQQIAADALVAEDQIAGKLPAHCLAAHVLAIGNIALGILMHDGASPARPAAGLDMKYRAAKRGRDKIVAPDVMYVPYRSDFRLLSTIHPLAVLNHAPATIA